MLLKTQNPIYQKKMSRSYKKHPVIACAKNPTGKREANKKVRRSKSITKGKSYRKLYCSYNICDYKADWRSWFSGKERASVKAKQKLEEFKRK